MCDFREARLMDANVCSYRIVPVNVEGVVRLGVLYPEDSVEPAPKVLQFHLRLGMWTLEARRLSLGPRQSRFPNIGALLRRLSRLFSSRP